MKKLVLMAITFTLLTGQTLYAQTGLTYFPLTPCRVVDTRGATGVNGAPYLTTVKRDFAIRDNCGVPTTAKAVTINVTVANPSANSWLTIWPSGGAKPTVSTINFTPEDWALANGAVVGLSTETQDLSVANAIGLTHVIIDVTGYFE